MPNIKTISGAHRSATQFTGKTKLFFLFLALTFCLIFLSGCNLHKLITYATPTAEPSLTATSTQIHKPNPTHTRTPTTTPLPLYLSLEPKAVHGTEIKLWHALRDDAMNQLVDDAKLFNETNAWGIHVTLHPELSDALMSEHLLSSPSVTEMPQIIIANAFWLKSWRKSGVMMLNLEHFLNHPHWGWKAQEITPILPEILALEYENDATLPSLPLFHQPHLLFYNDTWAQMIGFTSPPATWEAWKEQTTAAHTAIRQDDDIKNDGTGGQILKTDESVLLSWMINANTDLSLLNNFPQQSAKDPFIGTLFSLRSFFQTGELWQSRLIDPYEYFAAHQALLYSGTFQDIPAQQRAFAQSEKNSLDDWSLIPYPANNAQEENDDPAIFSEATSTAILTGTAEEQFAAWLFLSWLMQEERDVILAAKAKGWHVKNSPSADQQFKENTDQKIYRTLPLRQWISPLALSADWATDRLVLRDGVTYAFSPAMGISGDAADEHEIEKLTQLWKQILDTITEINQVK